MDSNGKRDVIIAAIDAVKELIIEWFRNHGIHGCCIWAGL
jgi:hypothetical protein